MKLFEKGELKLLWPFYLTNFLASIFYLLPAFSIVYFINIGLTLTQIGFLIATMPLASLIFEIPTGAIADLYGRKFSVLLGYFLQGVVLLTIFFTKNYYFLLTIFFLSGITTTLPSGSKEAWIFDLIKKKNKKYANKYFSKIQIFQFSGLALSGILGALFVKQFGISIMWPLSALGCFIGFFILMFSEEIYTKKKSESKSLIKLWKQSKTSISYSFKHPVLFYLLLSGFFMIISVVFSENLAFIPFLKDLGFPEYAFGYFSTAISLLLVMAPLFAKKLIGKRTELNFLIFATAIGSIIISLVYFVSNYFLALVIILTSTFFYGLKYPIERPYFHKFIPSKMRATIGSFESMLLSLAGLISLPLGGYLVDLIGARGVILISAVLGIPSIIAYLLIKEEKPKLPKETLPNQKL